MCFFPKNSRYQLSIHYFWFHFIKVGKKMAWQPWRSKHIHSLSAGVRPSRRSDSLLPVLRQDCKSRCSTSLRSRARDLTWPEYAILGPGGKTGSFCRAGKNWIWRSTWPHVKARPKKQSWRSEEHWHSALLTGLNWISASYRWKSPNSPSVSTCFSGFRRKSLTA